MCYVRIGIWKSSGLSASNIPEPLHVNLVATRIESFFNAFTSQKKKTISEFHISVTATAKNI